MLSEHRNGYVYLFQLLLKCYRLWELLPTLLFDEKAYRRVEKSCFF